MKTEPADDARGVVSKPLKRKSAQPESRGRAKVGRIPAKVKATGLLKRPDSPYYIWQREHWEFIDDMAQSPRWSRPWMAKAAELWNALSEEERAPYAEKFRQNQAAHVAHLNSDEGKREFARLKEDRITQAWLKRRAALLRTANKALEAGLDERLKQPPNSAYYLYILEAKEDICQQFGLPEGKRGKDYVKKAAENWNEMPEEEKRPWREKHAKLKEAYQTFLQSEEGQEALRRFSERSCQAIEEAMASAQDLLTEKATPGRHRRSPPAATPGRGATEAQGPIVIDDD